MYRRARLGIGYLPQEASIFRGLTVEQNIRLPSWTVAADGVAQRLVWIFSIMPEVGKFRERRAMASRDSDAPFRVERDDRRAMKLSTHGPFFPTFCYLLPPYLRR